MRLLFIGDSITDAGRDRADPLALGAGYVSIVASRLAARSPDSPVVVLNRGVSGDRAPAVEARWQSDCLDLHPDVVTVLVGVNDTWRRFDSGDPSPVALYEASLRAVLERSAAARVRRVILMEPFALHVGTVTGEWDEEMRERREVVRDLARRFGCACIPLQDSFDAAVRTREASALLHDGVHPTAEGHALIAAEWLAVFEQG